MKQFKLVLLIIAMSTLNTYAQEEEKKPVKKGWSFGVLPTITYNSDLGLQYGGLIDMYNYGEGDIFPKYYERYYAEISRFTKGSGINRFSFESNRLLKGRTVFIDINYRPDAQYDFLGGNGYESVYNPNWEEPFLEDGTTANPNYKSLMFYKNNTNQFKAKIDVLHPISDNWFWVSGFEYYIYEINSLDTEKYNNGRKPEDGIVPEIADMPGLWDRYKEWGIIDPKNASGGSFIGLKLGAMYDSRDNWTNASKGIWTEAIAVWVPSFVGNIGTGYLKFNLTHRQYFTILKDKLTFAYRLGYAGNITGDEPYFALPIMYSVMLKNAADEGLGGSRTLRGVRRNRVVGNGEAYGNAEFRYKFWNFKLFKQNWYLATNVFLDAGQVVNLLPLKERVNEINDVTPLTDKNIWGQYAIGYDAEGNPNGDTINDYFDFGAESLHVSYGIGIKIAMNENFVISADYGRSLKEADGGSGFYVALNYAF